MYDGEMYDYQAAKADEKFEYGVVTYLDGADEAVTAEGYVRGTTMDGTDEPIVVVVKPEQSVQIPFERIVKVQYETED